MLNVGLNHFLFLAAALFSIGVIGVLTRRNALVIFMCVEGAPPIVEDRSCHQ